MFCQKCKRYIDISDLTEHGSYHEALRIFQFKDLAPANLGSLTIHRKALIKEMLGRSDSSRECLDPVWLRKLDEAYEIIRAELESNARRVFGVNSREVCGSSLKCEAMPCIKAIGSCSAFNKRWRNVMDEDNTIQNCFGGDPTKCFLGLYSGYNGSNAAEISTRQLHKFVQSEIEKFDKCLQSQDAAVNGLWENNVEVSPGFSRPQGKQSIHRSLLSDGSADTSDNLKATPEEEGTRFSQNKDNKDSTTYACKVSGAFERAHHLVDEMLSSGKGETSRVRWSGCSTLTCLIQSHKDDGARGEAFQHNDFDATKEAESDQGTPNADGRSPRETMDTFDHQRASQQMQFHQRTHLATIHLANAGKT